MTSVSVACAPVAGTGEPEHFDPDDYLVGIVRRAVAGRGNIAIELRSMGEIRVLSARGEYLSSMPAARLAKFCAVPASLYQVRPISDRELATLDQTGLAGRNLDELMWQAAMVVARGRLMKGCLRDDVVQLKHWPNLTRLGTANNTLRIAALLVRYPTSITLAQRILKVPVAELYDFYSAARCAGLAVAVNRRPGMEAEPEIKGYRDRGLLERIMRRISGS